MMIKKVNQDMTQSLFIRRYSNRFLSRWLVLAIDLIIVMFSFSLSTLLRMNFHYSEIDLYSFQFHFALLLTIRVFVFLGFKSYMGIIRHTSIENLSLRAQIEKMNKLRRQYIPKSESLTKINEVKINEDLENNWAVVAEAIQTILRREHYPNPYEALKDLTRGNSKIDKKSMHKFIDGLKVTATLKKELKKITPQNYTGVTAEY